MEVALKRQILQRVSVGVLTIGLAMGMTAPMVMAQDAPATPEATVEVPAESAPVPATEMPVTAATKVLVTESIQTVTDAIAIVQQDRDAIASVGDMTQIDALLAKATEQRDAAKASLAADDAWKALDEATFAGILLESAQMLVEAEASGYGMPSMKASTSRVLVDAYYAIDEAADAVAESPEADPLLLFQIDVAKQLYARAYEQFSAGTFARAEGIASVASFLVAGAGPVWGETTFALAPVSPVSDGTEVGSAVAGEPAVVEEDVTAINDAASDGSFVVESDGMICVSAEDGQSGTCFDAAGMPGEGMPSSMMIVPGSDGMAPPMMCQTVPDGSSGYCEDLPMMDGGIWGQPGMQPMMIDPVTGEVIYDPAQAYPAYGSDAGFISGVDGMTCVTESYGGGGLCMDGFAVGPDGGFGNWQPAQLIVDESNASVLEVPAPEWT